MKINLKPTDGIIVMVLMKVLIFLGCPFEWLHEKLKRELLKLESIKFISWSNDELKGLYIEIWALSWALINIFIILPSISEASSLICYIIIAILILRSADLLKVFFAFTFNLVDYKQRSIARSYIIFILCFLEIAAITSSVQFIICKNFTLDNMQANWGTAFYYSIRNMVTIGTGDFNSSVCKNSAPAFFWIIRIIQPLFSVLLVSQAFSRILSRKNSIG